MKKSEGYALLASLLADPAVSGPRPVAPSRAFEALGLGPVEDPAYEADYARLLGFCLAKDAPPYETQYGSAHVFMETQELADIVAFYRAFGLSVAGGAHERPDHIAVELEFAAFLALKEETARDGGETELAGISADASRKFLKEHLARWVPAFAARLAGRAPESPLAPVAGYLREFVRSDAADRNAAPEEVRPVDLRPPAFDPDGDCGNCGLGDLAQTFFNAEEKGASR